MGRPWRSCHDFWERNCKKRIRAFASGHCHSYSTSPWVVQINTSSIFGGGASAGAIDDLVMDSTSPAPPSAWAETGAALPSNSAIPVDAVVDSPASAADGLKGVSLASSRLCAASIRRNSHEPLMVRAGGSLKGLRLKLPPARDSR